MAASGQIWFNEQSHRLQPDVFSAERLIIGFIDTLAEARRNGCKSRLRLDVDLFTMEVAIGYRIANWASTTSDVNRRQLLRTWIANSPFFQVSETVMADEALSYEFTVAGEKSLGLGLAWLFEGFALSFAVEPFLEDSVRVQVARLTDDDQLDEFEVTVPHMSSAQHVAKALSAVTSNRLSSISDGREMWAAREELFSELSFCRGVEEVVESLGANDPHFSAIRKTFKALDDLSRSWVTGELPRDQFPGKLSPESSKTLERYGSERTFEDGKSEKREFSMHGRLTPGAWRFYVWTEKVEGKLLIGYVGPKLRTVSDPT
jgi:hypothetical protein